MFTDVPNFCRKHRRRKSLGRSRHRWKDNFRMELKYVWGCGIDSYGSG